MNGFSTENYQIYLLMIVNSMCVYMYMHDVIFTNVLWPHELTTVKVFSYSL